MPNDDRLYDLLDAYRDLLARGGDVTPADLGVDADTFAQVAQLHRRSLAIENRLLPVRMPDPRPGVNTERYHTTRLLGSGGYGDVFRTDDRELGRAVALKVPRVLRSAAEEVNARLKAEAVLMGQLDHPGVPAVHSLGTDRATGRPFYTMRLIDGHTLADEIDRLHLALPPKLTAREFGDRLRPLLRRFVAVCAAVAYAHSRGVLHRDLKPHNVMLGAFDETLVMDWGLARAVSTPHAGEKAIRPEQIPAGQTLAAVGTIGYIAPEQWAADPTIDHRADVYSLGAVLYHLLAGRASLLPAEIGEGFRAESVRPIRQVKPNLPPALVAVCEKAMSADRAGRYSSAAELSADVQAWLDDRRVGAYREPWVDRAARWTRRHRTGVSITATAVPLLIALGLGWWSANVILGIAETQRAAAVAEKIQAETDAETTRTQLRNSARDRYPSALEVVDRLIEQGDLDAADRLLEEQRRVLADVNEQPGFEWSHRKAQVASQRPTEFPPFHAGKVIGLHQSDAYDPLISVAEDGSLVRWNADTRQVIGVATLDLGQNYGTSGFSYEVIDGRRQVTAVYPGMPAALAQPPMEVGDLIHSVGPNQDSLAPVEGLTDDAFIKLIPPAIGAQVCFETAKPNGSGRRKVTLTRARGFQPFRPAERGVTTFSRDGRRLAIGLKRDAKGEWMTPASELREGEWFPVVLVFDTATGNRLCEIPLPEKAANMQVTAVAFSPDGYELVVGFCNQVVVFNVPAQAKRATGYRVYDAATGKERSRVVWPKQAWTTEGFGAMAYSPDGKRIYGLGVEASLGTSVGYWPADKPNADPVTVVPQSAIEPIGSRLEVSDDGRWLLAHGNGGAALVSTEGAASRPLSELHGRVESAAFDPRGRLLAATDTDQRLIVWDTTSLQIVRQTLMRDRAQARALAFARDGRRVFVAQHFDITAYPIERNPGTRELGTNESSMFGGAAFHPSGDLLHISTDDQSSGRATIHRHDPQTGRPRGLLVSGARAGSAVLSSAQPSPDGTRVAVVSTTLLAGDVPEVIVYEAKTAVEVRRFPLPPELDAASCFYWLPDGKRLLLGERDEPTERPKEVAQSNPFPIPSVVCDLTTGQVERVTLSDSGATDITVSPDGKHLVVADLTSVYVRDPKTFQLRYRLRFDQGPAGAIAISGDSRWCVVGYGVPLSQHSAQGKRSTLMAFDLASGRPRFAPVPAGDGIISCIAYSPDDKTVACGNSTGSIHLLSAADGSLVREVRVTEKKGMAVTGLCFTDGGRELAATAMQINELPDSAKWKEGATAARFSVATGKQLAEFGGEVSGPVLYRSAYLPNSVTLLDHIEGTVRLFDTTDWGKPISTFRHTRLTPPSGVGELNVLTVSPDGRRVAGAATDGTVVVYSYPDGKTLRKWKSDELNLSPVTLRFTPDGMALVVAGIDKAAVPRVGRVVRLDVESGKPTPLVETPPLGLFTGGDLNLISRGLFALADDASTLFVVLAPATVTQGDVVAGFSLETGRESSRHQLPDRARVAAIGYCPATSSVYVSVHQRLEVENGQQVQAHDELYVWKVGEDSSHRVYQHSTRPRPIFRVADSASGVFRLAVSPDGRLVALRDWTTGTVRVFDVRTGKAVLTRAGVSGFGPLLFSPDGGTLANVPGHGRVVVFNSNATK